METKMNEKEFNRDEYISECYAAPTHNVRRPHKHAELIKAWADGAEIQQRHLRNNLPTHWYDFAGDWDDDIAEYRIKPEPKPDVVKYADACTYGVYGALSVKPNLKLTFDGETGELKSAEVLK